MICIYLRGRFAVKMVILCDVISVVAVLCREYITADPETQG
jgi:hypothetical protein